MASRALNFDPLVLTLPTGKTHVSFMKNNLSFWHQRELSRWAARLNACGRGWRYSVSTEPSQRLGKSVAGPGNSVIYRKTPGKTIVKEKPD